MKLTKRISLKYPTVWATLGFLLMVETVAGATIIYNNSHGVEGAISSGDSTSGICIYTRAPDTCAANDAGASGSTCYFTPNGHYKQRVAGKDLVNNTCPPAPTGVNLSGGMIDHANTGPAGTPPPA